MFARRSSLLLAIGLGVLAVAGVVGKLTWDRRQVRLEDAFRSLERGMDRLNQADMAGARKQFDESLDHFRTLGRDPLLALHHSLAAKLRAEAPPLPEVREISLPNSRAGERILEVALSSDSALFALATSHRLLCRVNGNEQWAEWDLPDPIENVAALHVDAESGRAHLVSGDDGKLIAADCRAAGSALSVAPSATHDEPAVAWLDADDSRVWVAPMKPAAGQVQITALPLNGEKDQPVELQVAFPGEANSIFADAAVVHSIGRVEDNILLFYGDSSLFHDKDMRDESVLVVSIDDPERQTNLLVFPSYKDKEDGGTSRWLSTHVRRLLPASKPGRVYALTEAPNGVAVLGTDAKPLEVHEDSLFSTARQDGGEIYDLSLKSLKEGPAMEVSRRGSGARLSYRLPWRFKHEPDIAAISADGRQVVVATATGGVVFIDVAKSL